MIPRAGAGGEGGTGSVANRPAWSRGRDARTVAPFGELVQMGA